MRPNITFAFVRLLLAGMAAGLVLAVSPAWAQIEEQAPESAPPPQNAPVDAPGQDDAPQVNFQTFYDSLGSEGTWIQTAQFGYVWQPQVNDPEWAPYTDGHWVYSDDGWTWASNEPWGWATYHYGRWANLDGVGWAWVPGYTWAPAWVSWRYGDGYVGWAPLPPDSLVGVDYDSDDDAGFHIGGDCDSYYGIGAGWYNFVPIGYLGEGNYRRYYADRHHNYGLINHTTNVTNLNVTRGGVAGNAFAGVSLGGPSLRQVNALSQTPVSRVNLAFTNRVGGGQVSGNSLALFAPRVGGGATSGARPQSTVRSIGNVGLNRGTDISHPLMVSPHLSTALPTSDEVHQARLEQAQAPADARLATPSAVPSASGRSLSSMHPTFSTAPETDRGASTFSGGQYERPASIYNAPRTYSPSAQGARVYSGGNGGGVHAGSAGGGGSAHTGGGSAHVSGGGGGGGSPIQHH